MLPYGGDLRVLPGLGHLTTCKHQNMLSDLDFPVQGHLAASTLANTCNDLEFCLFHSGYLNSFKHVSKWHDLEFCIVQGIIACDWFLNYLIFNLWFAYLSLHIMWLSHCQWKNSEEYCNLHHMNPLNIVGKKGISFMVYITLGSGTGCVNIFGPQLD